jgi:hypothetical protein
MKTATSTLAQHLAGEVTTLASARKSLAAMVSRSATPITSST